MDPVEIIDYCADKSRKAGLHPAWIFLKKGESSFWKEEKRFEVASAFEQEEGIGLRISTDDEQTLGAYTSDLRPEALALMVERLQSVRDHMSTDPDFSSRDRETSGKGRAIQAVSQFRNLDIVRQNAGGELQTRIKEFFQSLEMTLGRYKKYFDLTFSVSLQEGVNEVFVANTFGFRAYYKKTLAFLVLNLMGSRRGKTVLHWTVRASRHLGDLDPQLIAGTAAYELSVSLASKASVSGFFPVIFSPKAAAEFLGCLGSSFAAEEFFNGRSLFSGRLGGEIASHHVTILNRGDLKGGLGTMPFDAEGTGTRTITLVKNGVLNHLLFDRFQAEHRGGEPTGNLICHTFRELPKIMPLNLTLKPGALNLESLIKETGTGFYLLNTTDVGGTDALADRYQMLGSGLMIRNGQKAEPVSGIMLNGKISEMLKKIAGVGQDLYFSARPGFPAAPALLIDGTLLG